MIKEEIIVKADEFLQKLNEKDFEDLQKEVTKAQPNIVDYVLTMSEVFDDEEEYFDKFYYFFMLIHRAYSNRFRFFPEISMEIISTIEERDQSYLEKLNDLGLEETDKEMELMIKKHPQSALIDYITIELFDNDVEKYDDIQLELDNQIFFLCLTIINIYEQALNESQKDEIKAE